MIYVPAKNVGRTSPWRAATEFFLHVRRCQPVVIQAKTTAHHPNALACRIPGGADSRAPQIVDRTEQGIMCLLGKPVRDLFVLRCACPKIEIAEYSGWRLWTRDSHCRCRSVSQGLASDLFWLSKWRLQRTVTTSWMPHPNSTIAVGPWPGCTSLRPDSWDHPEPASTGCRTQTLGVNTGPRRVQRHPRTSLHNRL